MRKHIFSSFLGILLFALCSSLGAQQELTNDSIVKMVKAGLSPQIVVATVNTQPGHYDLSADGLIALKKAGADDQIISAMIAHSSGGAALSAGTVSPSMGASGLPPGIDSVGVYYKSQDGNWTEVGAEVVNFKTGGALKHIGSAGIVKGDLNGSVSGYHSRLELKAPTEFILYLPEGVSPGEYQLVRFRVSSDNREFRALTGGVVHASSGAARDLVPFESKKIATRVYQISLKTDAGKGEYGLLPPAAVSSSNMASSGKIYTFSISE
jgi:hypothetical protein